MTDPTISAAVDTDQPGQGPIVSSIHGFTASPIDTYEANIGEPVDTESALPEDGDL